MYDEMLVVKFNDGSFLESTSRFVATMTPDINIAEVFRSRGEAQATVCVCTNTSSIGWTIVNRY